MTSITSKLITEAATHRGWHVDVLDAKSDLYRIGLPDGSVYYTRNILGYKGNGINSHLTKHKDLFYKIAAHEGFSIPSTVVLHDFADAVKFLAQHTRVVIKPADQSHGDGVTVNVTTESQLKAAYALATSLSTTVLAQEQIDGDDYRLLFIGGKFVAAAIREPASVLGDGTHTIRELIDIENTNPARGKGYENIMTYIDLSAAQAYLGDRMGIEVPPAEQKVQVVGTANIGKGGVSVDVTDTLSQKIVDEAKRVVGHFHMQLCGIDYIVEASGKPYLIEANSMPSLGLHEYPVRGKARNTPDVFLDWLTTDAK
jgi:cyanophycin synthetase